MFILSPTLTIISLVICITSFICTLVIGVKTGKMFNTLQNNIGKISGFSEEMISSMPIIKQYGKEKETSNFFSKMSNRYRHYSVKANLYASLMMPISIFITNLGHMLIVGIGAILIIKGHTTVGSILAFITYFDMVKSPINQLASLFASAAAAMAGVNRIFKIMDEEIEDESGKVINLKGKIEFKNVSFGYNDKMVLKNISFRADVGEKIAIVGPTGAGKTTILNLINKFYLPNTGEVLIDDISTKNLSCYHLRKDIGLVAQEPYLFKGTIKENIYFKEGDEKKLASIGVASMIEKFNDGYNFQIIDAGENIAAGEKQLLTVARTALLNPKVLLLDEATSNVDIATERNLNNGLKKLIKNKTTITIAHRLTTTESADKIIVIDKGKIVEQGTHKELINKKGLYYNLYNTGLDE
jgi:ATP-binding cassette subfamily B protein